MTLSMLVLILGLSVVATLLIGMLVGAHIYATSFRSSHKAISRLHGSATRAEPPDDSDDE